MHSACHDKESRALLDAALVRVAETSFFAVVEPGGDAMAGVDGPWYSASVHFRGSCGGRVILTLPASLARELAGAFLGEDEIAEQVVRDLCGELVNQVTGTWLTSLDDSLPFDIDAPLVEETSGPGVGISMRVNDQPVVLNLDVFGAIQ